MTGTIINVIAIIAGSILGKLVGAKIPKSMQKTIIYGIGLVVLVLGIEMALKTSNMILILVSLVIGALIGEVLRIEEYLEMLGNKLETLVKKYFKDSGDVASGFVTATLLYVIGPMAIMGALENGLMGTYNLLAIKSSLDGISAIILTASLGIGVIFSAIPVFLYQGFISIFASWIEIFLSAEIIAEMTSLGGILIMAIGFNILEVIKVKVANMLPGLIVVVIISSFFI